MRPAEALSLAMAAVVLLLAIRMTVLDYLDYLKRKGGRMAGFNAATVVEALDWTFEPFVPGAKGVIAEPTDEQIKQYLAAVKAMAARIKEKVPDAPDGTDPADLMAALDDLDLDSVAELTGEMAGIVAALCSDSPSKETILALPPRRRTMFYGWLQQEVMSPEAVPAAGNAQVRTLRSAVGG